ncbi:MAG: hypothetical protein ABIA12_03110 [Candidatus Aenigmatarchaeota archaeon]
MVKVPKEFSDFWTPIDPYFRSEHVRLYETEDYANINATGKIHYARMEPALAPLLYFEKDTFGSRQIFLGSIDLVQAVFEGEKVATGSVYFNSFFGSYDLADMVKMLTGGTVGAYMDRERQFSIFSPRAYCRNITADHEKIKARLRELRIAHIDIPYLKQGVTSGQLGSMIGIYNERVRASNLELDILDPLTPMLTYAVDPRGEASLNARIEKAASKKRQA